MPRKSLTPKVIVILGQTATGKSAFAVMLARKIGGEVISADSRQIYKGLDIGTGKITKEEMRGVPHHLLGIASPRRRFTVAQYQKRAASAISKIIKRGKIPIICGGTGFYIDAITKGITFPQIPPNSRLRKKLQKEDTASLYTVLKKLDPKRAKNIDPYNKVRLIRAIEVATALGRVPSLQSENPDYEFIKLGLYLPPDKLRQKVEFRVVRMFKDGLLEEIKKLKKSGITDSRLQEFGFEYCDPTLEKVIRETLRYAKRQMTWFKRDPEIKWLDASDISVKTIQTILNSERKD